MNLAALKIKGNPSDVFNRGKSNQERKLTGTELPVVSGNPIGNGFNVV